MKSEIEAIIKKLERAQDLIHENRSDEASTVVYEAQVMAIFLRDRA